MGKVREQVARESEKQRVAQPKLQLGVKEVGKA